MTEKQTNDVTTPKLDVSVRLIEPKGKLMGFASVTFNDSFVVDGFSIVQGKNGIFVGMPSRPDENAPNGYRETAKPITADFRAQLNEVVGTAYHLKVTQIQEQAKAHADAAPPKSKLSKQLAEGKEKAVAHNATLAPSTQEKEIATSM